jgi:hypothetical protein
MDNTSWEARQRCCVDISFISIAIDMFWPPNHILERLGFYLIVICQSPALSPTQYHGDLMRHLKCKLATHLTFLLERGNVYI